MEQPLDGLLGQHVGGRSRLLVADRYQFPQLYGICMRAAAHLVSCFHRAHRPGGVGERAAHSWVGARNWLQRAQNLLALRTTCDSGS